MVGPGKTPSDVSLGEASNILLLGSLSSSTSRIIYRDFISKSAIDTTDIISVNLAETPDCTLDNWIRFVGPDLPEKFGFVSVDDQCRSATTNGNDCSGRSIEDSITRVKTTGSIQITAVCDPTDFTEIGIAITEFLSAWEADGNRVELCFHSVTELLQVAELREVYQFLFTLTRQIDLNGATGYYLLDPSAHGREEIEMIKTLMDAVVEVDEDGGYSVKEI